MDFNPVNYTLFLEKNTEKILKKADIEETKKRKIRELFDEIQLKLQILSNQAEKYKLLKRLMTLLYIIAQILILYICFCSRNSYFASLFFIITTMFFIGFFIAMILMKSSPLVQEFLTKFEKNPYYGLENLGEEFKIKIYKERVKIYKIYA